MSDVNKSEDLAVTARQDDSISSDSPDAVKGDSSSLNLFRVPHNRMKELVSWPLKGVQDLDVQDLEPSLQVHSLSIILPPFHKKSGTG